MPRRRRRHGHALRVVAGGVGDDRCGPQGSDRVVGATELERAGALQRLGLDQQPTADHGVERVALQQRRFRGDPAQAIGGRGDIGEAHRQPARHATSVPCPQSRSGSPARLSITAVGSPGRRSAARPPRLSQMLRRPNDAAPWTSQPLAETKPMADAGSPSRAVARPVDLRCGLEHTDLVDGQDRIDQSGDTRSGDGFGQHVPAAVRQDGGPHPSIPQLPQRRPDVGERRKSAIGREQPRAQSRIGDAQGGKRMIERVGGDVGEVRRPPHQRAAATCTPAACAATARTARPRPVPEQRFRLRPASRHRAGCRRHRTRRREPARTLPRSRGRLCPWRGRRLTRGGAGRGQHGLAQRRPDTSRAPRARAGHSCGSRRTGSARSSRSGGRGRRRADRRSARATG